MDKFFNRNRAAIKFTVFLPFYYLARVLWCILKCMVTIPLYLLARHFYIICTSGASIYLVAQERIQLSVFVFFAGILIAVYLELCGSFDALRAPKKIKGEPKPIAPPTTYLTVNLDTSDIARAIREAIAEAFEKERVTSDSSRDLSLMNLPFALPAEFLAKLDEEIKRTHEEAADRKASRDTHRAPRRAICRMIGFPRHR